MDTEQMEQYMPPELAAQYEPVALLRQTEDRQTLLVQSRTDGEQLVLKRTTRPTNDAEEKYEFLKTLGGEGVPAVRRFFRSGGADYLLRAYVPGQTLLDWAQKRGTVPAREAAAMGAEICRILKRLHSHTPPLIHRDIKAENIIRTPEGELVLIDFDIARFYNSEDTRDTDLLGSAFSAPPEQFGYRQTDPRADVYAMGVLLHELVTGESRLDRGQTPPLLRRIVKRCTQFDPADRYRDAGELERALRRAADRRRPWLRAGAAVVGAAALVLSTVLAVQIGERRAIYSFASPAIEAEVCRQLGKEPGTVTRDDLEAVTALLLCGEEPFDRYEQLDVHGREMTVDYVLMSGRGTVDTLEDIPNMPHLLDLALCGQAVTDLSPLADCAIQRLALPGNGIRDLSPLAGNDYLQELCISDNPVSDLSPLASCGSLHKLNAGATDLEDLDALADMPGLTELAIHDCEKLADLSALTELKGLTGLSMRPVSPETLDVICQMDGLYSLLLWGERTMTDLTPLTGLPELEWLYLDVESLESLRGAEEIKRLYYLDVRSDTLLDPAPLINHPRLETVNVAYMDCDDWSWLNTIPNLRGVSCSVRQKDAIQQVLADRPGVDVAVF